jgi:hypothetical protein
VVASFGPRPKKELADDEVDGDGDREGHAEDRQHCPQHQHHRGETDQPSGDRLEQLRWDPS